MNQNTTRNDYNEALNNFRNLYNLATQDTEEAYEEMQEDVLCIDVRTNIDVQLTIGGPTVFLRFPAIRTSEGYEIANNAEYHSNDNDGHTMQIVRLSEEETETLWNIYGLEYYNN